MREKFIKYGINRIRKKFIRQLYKIICQEKNISNEMKDSDNIKDLILDVFDKMDEHRCIGKEYARWMKNWQPNEEIAMSPEKQFEYESNTVFFKAWTNMMIKDMQTCGVKEVQIRSYFTDMDSEISREMSFRSFDITKYVINEDELLKDDIKIVFEKNNRIRLYEAFLPPYHFNCRAFFKVGKCKTTKDKCLAVAYGLCIKGQTEIIYDE